MKNLNFSQMESDLKKRFHVIDLFCNSEYSPDYPKNMGFWVKKADEQTYTDKDKNALYLSNDYFNSKYELNIYKKFDAFCEARGWYCSSENFTLQIFK